MVCHHNSFPHATLARHLAVRSTGAQHEHGAGHGSVPPSPWKRGYKHRFRQRR